MYTKSLSDFVQSIRYRNLTKEVVEAVKMCIQDIVGVAIGGSVQETALIWRHYYNGQMGDGDAVIWGAGFEKGGYREVAALNSAFGHLMDLDDLHNSSIAHLGVVTIPAVIAIGQKYKKSGKEVIASIVAGYEAGARIGEAINPSSYWFWHTTAVVGSFATCAAVGNLLGLNQDQMLNCFGSAGTQSGGLWQFLSDGAMSKSLHTANATICGMRAAELAMLGFTGAQEILEGDRGFVKAIAKKYDMEALTRNINDKNYKILKNSFKLYACCRHTHSAIYCLEKILQSKSLIPEEIIEIKDYTYKIAKDLTDKPYPKTAYAYKFSLQYCIAAFLIYGNLSDAVFSEEGVNNPLVKELMGKVNVIIDDDLEERHCKDPNIWPHRLEIRLKDGSLISELVEFPIGDFNNPFDWDMADKKFTSVVENIITEEKTISFLQNVKNLEKMNDINHLFLI